MAKTREQKEAAVGALIDKIKGAKSTIIFNYDGLKVAQTSELREMLRKENVELVSTKKTILKLVLEKNDLKDADVRAMQGSLAIAMSVDDEVVGAKVIKDFAKTHEQVKFQGGVLEGKLVSIEMVNSLASLPSKIELLAKVVGTIKAPITGFVNVLAGNLRGLVNVLNAIKDTK